MKLDSLIVCLFLLLLILFPSQCTQGALEGIRLSGSALIPALLPFLFLTRLLCDRLPESGRRSGKPARRPLLPLILSLVGGYPTGVAAAVSLYEKGKLSKRETERLLPFCNNSGPGFFVGVLGAGLWGDPRKGLVLYGIHLVTALWSFLLFYRHGNGDPLRIRELRERKEKVPFSRSFQEALGDSCTTMVRICGLVILFSVLRKLAEGLLPAFLLPYFGLVELSSGLLSPGAGDPVLWAVFMGWGGLCVHLQAMSIWQGQGLQVRGYFSLKLLHGLLSGLCALAWQEEKLYRIPLIFLFCWIISFFVKNGVEKKETLQYNKRTIPQKR